jgi:hypothetical protein
LPFWKNALFSENAVAYNATEGGLFRGYQSYDLECNLKGEKKVVKKGWELKIICLDKYFHDLFRDKLLGIVDERGVEKVEARNDRWYAVKEWVGNKNEEAEKSGDYDFTWWSQKRDDFDLWIDFGFLYSTKHFFQKPHYDYRVLKEMLENWSAFIGLTESGMFLQIWPQRPEVPRRKGPGKVVDAKMNEYPRVGGVNIFIPKGVGLAVGGDTCHGGGFFVSQALNLNKWGIRGSIVTCERRGSTSL